MCLLVFAAANEPLPLIPYRHGPDDSLSETWPEHAQRLCAETITESESAVRARFTGAHVIRLGSYDNCGCGFDTDNAEQDDAHAAAATRESIAALARYVMDHGVTELYACWSGDEGLDAVGVREMRCADPAASPLVPAERELVRIVRP